jgi:hypothetical protein
MEIFVIITIKAGYKAGHGLARLTHIKRHGQDRRAYRKGPGGSRRRRSGNR